LSLNKYIHDILYLQYIKNVFNEAGIILLKLIHIFVIVALKKMFHVFHSLVLLIDRNIDA